MIGQGNLEINGCGIFQKNSPVLQGKGYTYRKYKEILNVNNLAHYQFSHL